MKLSVKSLTPYFNTGIKTGTLESDNFEWAVDGSREYFEELGRGKTIIKIIDGKYYLIKDKDVVGDILYRLEDQLIDMGEVDKKHLRASGRVVNKIKEGF